MKKILRGKDQTAMPQPSHEFFDIELGCYVEEYFHEMLTFERRRSERSGRPFLVMTIDFTQINRAKIRKLAVKDTVDALSQLTRDTDIKGWYRSSAILGVIFTEMNSMETESLQKKIYQNLLATLPEEHLDEIQIYFHRFPDDGKPGDSGSQSNFNFYPDYPRRDESRKIEFRIKRAMDVVGSIVGILVFSPLFIMIALCIKLTSRGPVLFMQERVGQYEKKFMFLKFRTMYVNNDPTVHKEFVHNLITKKNSGGKSDGQKVYKIVNDKRITPIGNFLRKSSLDELPQFFNVLTGDMSLTGPRPPIPYELEKYDIWHRCRVLEVKPGITGLWQVEGRSSTTFDEMVRLDLQYARNWSLWLDIKIMLNTPRVLLLGKGAY
jgi:exopolysaccharide biosynthesis polyprenyl glycosylphosphotransferase